MPPISIDLILHCQWVLPIVPNDQILPDHSVAIDGGRILEILPTASAIKKYNSTTSETLSGHILMPGLIDTYCQSSTRLLRGFNSGARINQALEHQLSDTSFVEDSLKTAIAEMIKGGTTCFAEMHSAGELLVDIACDAGIRSQASFILQEKSSVYGKDAEDYLHRGLKLRDNYSSHSLIKIACGLSNISQLENKTLDQLAAFANELDLPIQIKCNDTKEAIDDCFQKTGYRPLQRLNQKGLLLPETQLVEMNHLNAEDNALLQQTKTHQVLTLEHCQNLSNDNSALHSLGNPDINSSFGTANANDNNGATLMTVIKAAADAAQQNSRHRSQQDTAHQALRMATINGAKTLGWDRQIGSIEEGKYADLIAIEIDSLHHQPLYNPASQLVYSPVNSPVTHSWVAGRPLLKAGNLCTLDEQKLIQSAKAWGKTLTNQAT